MQYGERLERVGTRNYNTRKETRERKREREREAKNENRSQIGKSEKTQKLSSVAHK